MLWFVEQGRRINTGDDSETQFDDPIATPLDYAYGLEIGVPLNPLLWPPVVDDGKCIVSDLRSLSTPLLTIRWHNKRWNPLKKKVLKFVSDHCAVLQMLTQNRLHFPARRLCIQYRNRRTKQKYQNK
jgi:hypothetical protein